MRNRVRSAPGPDERRRALTVVGLTGLLLPQRSGAQHHGTIETVKRSIVAVGTFQRTRAPQFQFRGTGFAVGDGTLVVTNAHVLPDAAQAGADAESLAIALPMSAGTATQARIVKPVAIDREHDLALLRVPGPPLPAVEVGDSDQVREGDLLLLTGFPLGTILGTFPVTHRAMIAAIAPIAIPQGNARALDPALIRRLQGGALRIFQLDASIQPGNSGSPLYDPATGQVLGVVNMAFVRKPPSETPTLQSSGIAYAIPARHLSELLSSVSSAASGPAR